MHIRIVIFFINKSIIPIQVSVFSLPLISVTRTYLGITESQMLDTYDLLDF